MERPRMPDKSDRPRLVRAVEPVGSYFTKPTTGLKFIKSGCAVLDCALGGGYPLGRVVNIVGDRSTGKTLLAIEAASNFFADYDGHVFYCETEAALDHDYARALGIDIDRVLRPKERVRTVEEFFAHLQTAITNRGKLAGLYILDSLDALSDDAEMKRDIGEGSYGASKAKKMSEAFRRVIQMVEDSNTCVMIISQVRDNIGVTFGKKHTRSGGRALDFYASQIIMLAQLGTVKKTINKIERAVGIRVRAKLEKNKVALPMREAEFEIRFGFGINDVASNITWLDAIGRVGEVKSLVGRNHKLVASRLDKLSPDEYAALRQETATAVRAVWSEVEKSFMPSRAKYSPNGAAE